MSNKSILQLIDYGLLKKQKLSLLQVIEKLYSSEKNLSIISNLEGLIALIEAIQDYAVDELGYSEEEVFNQTNSGHEFTD